MFTKTIICGIFFEIILLLAIVSCKTLTDYEQSIASGTYRKACALNSMPPQPPSRVDTSQKLKALRAVMNNVTEIKDRQTLQAFVVTSDDEHQSEYVSNYDKRREFISGFSGSNGDAVITMDKAALWVDGRYHVQANDQLDCNWLLMREGNRLVPTIAQWLKLQFPNGGRIGADPKLLSADSWNALEYELQSENENLLLVQTNVNLIDIIWSNHSETEQEKQAFTLDDIYTGKKWTKKVEETRQELKKLHAEAMVVTALDEIAWLLNIRGRDIPYTRFVKSYVLLSQTEINLYVDQNKTKENVTVFFNAHIPGISHSTVKIRDYHMIWNDLITYCQKWKSVLVPAACVYSPGASKKIYDLVPDDMRISKPSPIIYMKAKKNPVEILGMENSHIRDGAAMCMLMEYLETWFAEHKIWTELEIAREVDRFRMEQDLALNTSFPTIVAFAHHGAQPHYEPTPATSLEVFDNSTIVIDSGGQYCDGTTDVTRTIHLGTPTARQQEMYTRVLMGSIQLSTLTFPDNLKTSGVDVLARAPLWEIGEDYPHGTGHGIGAFLAVHESPIYIHYNPKMRAEHFKPGYFFSNEPGIYLENQFGVRLENILEVIEKPHLKQESGHNYLGFKDVTLVPYCNKLINFDLLSGQQKRWLNDYNARIRTHVGAELKRKNATDAFYWMMENTKHIPDHGSIKSSQPLHLLLINIVLIKLSIAVLY